MITVKIFIPELKDPYAERVASTPWEAAKEARRQIHNMSCNFGHVGETNSLRKIIANDANMGALQGKYVQGEVRIEFDGLGEAA